MPRIPFFTSSNAVSPARSSSSSIKQRGATEDDVPSPSPSSSTPVHPPPPPYKDDPIPNAFATTTITTTTTTTTTTQTKTQTQHVIPALSVPFMPLLRRKSMTMRAALTQPEASTSTGGPHAATQSRTVSSPVTFPSRDSYSPSRPSIDRVHLLTKPLPAPPSPSPTSSSPSPSPSVPIAFLPSTPALHASNPSLTLTPSSPPVTHSREGAEHLHALSPPSASPTSYLAHASLFPLRGLGFPPPLPLPPTLDPTSVLEPSRSVPISRRRFSIRRARSFERPPPTDPSPPLPPTSQVLPKRPRTSTSAVHPPLVKAQTTTPPSGTRKPSFSFTERAALWGRKRSQTSAPEPSASSTTTISPASGSSADGDSGLLPPFPEPPRRAAKRRISSGLLSFPSRAAPDPRDERGERRSVTLLSPAQIGTTGLRLSDVPVPHTESVHSSRESPVPLTQPVLQERERPPPRPRSATLDSLASLATTFPWTRNSLVLSPSFTLPFTPSEPTPIPISIPIPPSGPASTPPLSSRSVSSPPGSAPTKGLHGVRFEEDGELREGERGEKTEEEEEMEIELERLVRTVNRGDLSSVLCGTPLLALHLSRLCPSPFPPPTPASPGMALDISLRLLLMHLALPRETQAIDKVVETFAVTWAKRYPGLITSDQAYLIAFSLIMLHTDHFNKSNKRKMSKEDYVRNTKSGGGVSEVVLEYFYDNITFAPFIFIEDTTDVNGLRSLLPQSDAGSPIGLGMNAPGNAKSAKRVDVYYLITQGRLDPLRAQVDACIPKSDPFSYAGTAAVGSDPRVDECHDAFANASEVRVDVVRDGAGAGTGGLGQFAALGTGTGSMPEANPEEGEMVLKLTKVGTLNRKDDFAEGGKKASNRKWREMGVAITGSQLLFFRDPAGITALKKAADAARDLGLPAPRLPSFKPDDWVSLRDAVGLFDASYSKYENVFRLVLSQGRQYLFQASSEPELNDWLVRINYAASFKTAGVRMRSAGMTSGQLGLAALAAAESHVRDVKSSLGSDIDSGRGSPASPMRRVVSLDHSPTSASLERLVDGIDEPPTEAEGRGEEDASLSPSAPSMPDPADQLEATFREIKAELAASRSGMADLGFGLSPAAAARRKGAGVRAQSLGIGLPTEGRREMMRSNSLGALAMLSSPANSSGELSMRKGWLASRSEVIQRRISQFDEKIRTMEPHLQSDLRAAENLAILTPFQRSTRDKIQAAVLPLAKRIRQLRIELARLYCYRDVLSADLEAERREWAETRQVAFDAAEARLGGTARERALRVDVPRMTLSMHLESPQEMDVPSLDGHAVPRTHGRPSSSTGGSYYSALENHDAMWPSPDDAHPGYATPQSLFRSRSTLVGSGTMSTEPPSSTVMEGDMGDTPPSPAYPFPLQLSETVLRGLGNGLLSDTASPASPEEEEQAEDWESTRAARRVSLVQVPASVLRPRSLRPTHGAQSSQSSRADSQLSSPRGKSKTLPK